MSVRSGILLLAALVAGGDSAQSLQPPGQPQVLFPEPFVVEHQVQFENAAGEVTRLAPVRDHYVGSAILSVRSDGSRLIVDLDAGRLTEVRPARGVYWTLDFAVYADLREQVQALEQGGESVPREAARRSWRTAATRPAPRRDLVVVETTASDDTSGAEALASGSGRSSQNGATLFAEARVFRVTPAGDPGAPGVEVWVHGSWRFSELALVALDEAELLLSAPRSASGATSGATSGVRPSARAESEAPPGFVCVQAARRAGAGGVVLRSRRPAELGGGFVEDRTTLLERLDSFDADLLAVPEGLRRVPHPLELVLARERRERELWREQP